MKNFKSIILQSSGLLIGLSAILISAEYSQVQAQSINSNTTIEEVADEEVTIGTEVTIRGDIEEVESGISFTIEEEDLFAEEQVLVINTSEQVIPKSAEDSRIQVTGKVGAFILADVERDYGLALDPEIYAEYESQPVIFATYMVEAPELEEVAENPDSYYGQEIALEGEVAEIRNDYAFTLKESQLIGGDDLLIINATNEPIPQEDETVVITGTVRPYIKAEFEQDYDLTWDLDIQEEIEAEYTDKPVLVVDSIYPSAKDNDLSFSE